MHIYPETKFIKCPVPRKVGVSYLSEGSRALAVVTPGLMKMPGATAR